MKAQTTFWLFNLALLPLYPLLAAYTLWRRFGQKKSAASFRGQWGRVPPGVLAALRPSPPHPLSRFTGEGVRGEGKIIWIHAVSVGEQMAARPIARALKSAIPDCKIALSVTTDTGFQTAQNAIKSGEADAVFYFPLDLPFTVSRALKAVKPDVFLAVETELWPNFLHLARARGVLCLLVNGRVSDSLLQRATKTKWLWRWMISNLSGLLMRSQFDAKRMQQIVREVGAGEDAARRVLTMGDVKLDGLQDARQIAELRERRRAELKISEGEVLWVCGSTHPGEEAMALRVYQEIRAQFPELKLLLAPRHIERNPEILELLASQNLAAQKRSALQASGAQIILLDTVGELSEIYAAADVAFVGGSLIPRGGHNVLEPILRGVPVLFGPHMANFRSHAELIQNSSLGDCVQSEAELAAKLALWIKDENRRRALPERAASTLAAHQGAPARIAEHIAERMEQK